MLHGRNELKIGEEVLLLVDGNKAHLARRADDAGTGQPAIPDWYFDSTESWQGAYDLAELRAPLWSARTLCGRRWNVMASADGPSLSTRSEPRFAPECGSCIRITSRMLSSAVPDDRVALVSTLTVAQVVLVGSAQVIGVPGDQAEALRTSLRQELRKRGLRGMTRQIGDTVHVVSDDAWDQLSANQREASSRAVADALEEMVAGGDRALAPARPDWILDWNTWSVS